MRNIFAFIPRLFSPRASFSLDGPISDEVLAAIGNARRTTSGITVSATNSMQLAAYYACIRNISEDIAKLPVKVVRKTGGRTDPLQSSPIGLLFSREPNPDMTPFSFKETLTSWALGWGNGYAEIVRNGRGEVSELRQIHPGRVRIIVDDDGEIFYEVYQNFRFCGLQAQPMGESVILPQRDMFHLKGLGGDGLCGFSVANFAAESLGTALAAQQFGGAFFGNGTNLGLTVSHPGNLSKEATERLAKSLDERHKGSGKAYRTLVLEEGLTVTNPVVPPKDAQFIELREFQVVEVARWFRMPPHKIQDLTRATFSNIEEQNLDYVTDTLMPWISRWEQEIKRKLITPDNVFARFSVQALLRGDQKTRSEFYRTMFNLGVFSINEIRGLEDMNPIGENGDEYFMQTNMATVESIVNTPEEPEPAPEPEPPEEPPEEDTEEGTEEDMPEEEDAAVSRAKVRAYVRPMVEHAAKMLNAKERKATERALKKKAKLGGEFDLDAWADKFYGQHAEHAHENLLPVLEALRKVVNVKYHGLLSGVSELRGNLHSEYRGYCETFKNFAKFADEGEGFEVSDVDTPDIFINYLWR